MKHKEHRIIKKKKRFRVDRLFYLLWFIPFKWNKKISKSKQKLYFDTKKEAKNYIKKHKGYIQDLYIYQV